MLDVMRRQTQNTLIWVALGVVIFVFIFFFGPQTSGFAPTGQTWAGKIGRAEVSDTELRAAWQRSQDRFGRRGRVEDAEYYRQLRAVLHDIALVHLLAERATTAGLGVTDREVACYIANWNRNLLRDGEAICEKFPKQYASLYPNFDFVFYTEGNGRLSSSYTSDVRGRFAVGVEDYEAFKAQELLAIRYLDLLAEGIAVGPAEVAALHARRNETVDLEYIKLDPEGLAPDPTPEEIAAFATTSRDAVAAFHAANPDRFKEDRQVRIRRIYLRRPETEDPAARAKFDNLLARARTGDEAFDALARENTELDREKESGGDMGLRTADSLTSELFNATADMKIGDVKAVEQTFAWNIIRLEEVREARTRPLDEVALEIAAELLREQQRERLRTGLDARGRRILEHARAGNTLEAAAALENDERVAAGEPAAPLTVSTTGPFAREQKPQDFSQLGAQFANFRFPPPPADQITGIGQSRELMKAAFELSPEAPVLDRLIEVGGVHYVVRLRERKSAASPVPDDVAAELHGELQRAAAEKTVGPQAARQRLLLHMADAKLPPFLQTLLDEATSNGTLRINEKVFTFDPAANPGTT